MTKRQRRPGQCNKLFRTGASFSSASRIQTSNRMPFFTFSKPHHHNVLPRYFRSSWTRDTGSRAFACKAQKKLDEASHEVTSWIRSMSSCSDLQRSCNSGSCATFGESAWWKLLGRCRLPLLAASVHLSSQQESGGLGRAYGGPLGLSAKKTGGI